MTIKLDRMGVSLPRSALRNSRAWYQLVLLQPKMLVITAMFTLPSPLPQICGGNLQTNQLSYRIIGMQESLLQEIVSSFRVSYSFCVENMFSNIAKFQLNEFKIAWIIKPYRQ
jgi:hypothetical protein